MSRTEVGEAAGESPFLQMSDGGAGPRARDQDAGKAGRAPVPSRWIRCCQESPLTRCTGAPSSSSRGSERALLCLFGPSPAQCPVPFILTECVAERVYLCLLGFVRNQCCVHTGEGQDQTARPPSKVLPFYKVSPAPMTLLSFDELLRTTVLNLFGTRDQFCGRQLFQRLGWGGAGGRVERGRGLREAGG